MGTIKIVSGKEEREVEIEKPDVLEAQNLQDLIDILGNDMVFNYTMAQLTIAFRAKIRNMLESRTEDELTYTDDDIIALDFADWKPETKVRMSKTEKIAKDLEGLSADQLELILAKLKEQQEGAEAAD